MLSLHSSLASGLTYKDIPQYDGSQGGYCSVALYLNTYDNNEPICYPTVQNHTNHCYNPAYLDPAVNSWVAPSNIPTNDVMITPVNVTSPTETSFNFDLNNVLMFCRYTIGSTDQVTLTGPAYNLVPAPGYISNNSLDSYSPIVKAIKISSISGSSSNIPTISYPLNQNTVMTPPPYGTSTNLYNRYWFSSYGFSVNFPHPLTQTTIVTVTITEVEYVNWNGYTYCVKGGNEVPPGENPQKYCPSGQKPFNITFNPSYTVNNFTVLKLNKPTFNGFNGLNPVTFTSQYTVALYGNSPLVVNKGGINYSINYYYIDTSGNTHQLSSYDQSGAPEIKVSSSGDSYTKSKTSSSIPIASLVVGDQICAQIVVAPRSGTMDAAGNILTSDNTPRQATQCVTINAIPYARFYGNDVIAGAQFDNSYFNCGTAASNPQIYTLAAGTGPRSVGSGSQYAAMSTGQITSFASAFLQNISISSSDNNTYLTFANSNVPGSWGGSSGDCPTIENFYNQMPTTNILKSSINNISSLNTYSNGGQINYLYVKPQSGTLTIDSSGQLNNPLYIYVNGNVDITKNILMNHSQSKINNYGQVQNNPVFRLIVQGNIYIDGGSSPVTQLDGIYIAENKCDTRAITSCQAFKAINGGLINTCGNSNNGTNDGSYPKATLYDNCNYQLYVTGSFIADRIKLDRTYSSINNSKSGENPYSGNTSQCNIQTTDPPSPYGTCAAEEFNYDPLTDLLPSGQSVLGGYNSITSLPPVASY